MALVTINDNTTIIRRNKDELKEKSVSKVDGNGTVIYNGLKSLVNGEKITILKLCDLLLEELPEDLPDLIHLTEINLSGNKLYELPKKLVSAKRLRILNLSRNNFSVVPECLIIGLCTLKEIDLSENYLNNFDIPPACLPILKDLLIAHNDLLEIPEWIITDHKYILNILDLSFNPCFEFKKDFKKPSNSHICGSLRVLKLVNTNFSIVSIGLLLYFPTLVSLDISNCVGLNPRKSALLNSLSSLNIEYLPSELEELFMKDISLTILPDLSSLKKLKILDVSDNLLHWLPADESLTNSLCNIDLSCSVLMMLPDYIGKINKVSRLMLSNNDIASLPASFNLLINLEALDLYNNSLETLPDLKSFTKLKAFDICMNYFEPPSNPLGEGGPNYEDLKSTLRESNNFRNRSDAIKEVVEEDELPDRCSSSRCSISSECSFAAYPEVVSESKNTEEEDWDLGTDDDIFDPTTDNIHRKQIIDEIQNQDFGKNCLKYCADEIKNSPHLFQPYAERSNSDCWKKQINYMKARRFSVVEGQFDDV